MNRRTFLATAAITAWASAATRAIGPTTIETVRGPIVPADLGPCLPHEHVLVDFIGANKATPDRYEADEVVRVALPQLVRVRELGCRTLFECTPAYLGRDPRLLRRLSEASGLNLITNTGYYAANGGKHLPAFVADESPEQLAARWIAEAREGIDGTGIRPGFIKIGVDAGPLNAAARKLIRAAAIAHRATGLTVASHTGDGPAAFEQLSILRDEKIDASVWIWVHAQNEPDVGRLADAASQGAWIELDNVGPESIEATASRVKSLIDRCHAGRLLLSQDAGWYHVGEAGGGTFRPYDTLFTGLLPALDRAGIDAAAFRRLTVDNPRAAFTPRPFQERP